MCAGFPRSSRAGRWWRSPTSTRPAPGRGRPACPVLACTGRASRRPPRISSGTTRSTRCWSRPASVSRPRRTRKAAEELHDPLILQLEMASGILVDDEVFVNAGYGYDVRGEVVCESGTVALADVGEVTLTANGRRGGRVPADWRDRLVPGLRTRLARTVAAGNRRKADRPRVQRH